MDGEYPNIFEEKIVKARKEHTCCECQNKIFKNEVYSKVKGHWTDGGWQEFKTCIKCIEIRHEVSSQEWGIPAFGNLADWAYEAGISMPENKHE